MIDISIRTWERIGVKLNANTQIISRWILSAASQLFTSTLRLGAGGGQQTKNWNLACTNENDNLLD